MYGELSVFTGTTHPALAQAVCDYLRVPLGNVEVNEFSNENIFVKFNDPVRSRDVFIIQSGASPVSRSVMELLIMLDAAKRASAGRITAVVPYFTYGRTDKKDQPRVPITARLLADLYTVAGANRVLTVDLHAGQIQGFFSIPVDELTAVYLMSRYFVKKQLSDPVVVCELGFAKRGRNFAELLGVPLAIIEKRRVGNSGSSELMSIIGDVRGKQAVIIDDEIDTAGSIINAVAALQRDGVAEIYACCSHAVFSGPAVKRLRESPIKEIIVTDTLPLPAEKQMPQLTVLSLAPLIGETIARIHAGSSVSSIYEYMGYDRSK
ncbi:MAG: ribose-phosphate pyrophosphokinase [Dehalococcoidia bacterium]|nr:ribose-phosphate pyrophosphokinase [Dehalococcoidia bacterium]